MSYMTLLPRDFLVRHVPFLRYLAWNAIQLAKVDFPLSNLFHLPYEALYEPLDPLRAVLGLISSAPLLDELFISIDVDVPPHPYQVQDIHLGSLRCLELQVEPVLSRVLPHFKVPQLKEFSLLVLSDIEALTIADLLPSNSYPLLMEATSMDFYAGLKNSRLKLTGEGVEVTVVTFIPHMGPTVNFSTVTSFSLAQITKLVLVMTVKPMVAKISEFINLELLNLMHCEEDVENFSAPSPMPGSVALVPRPYLAGMKGSSDSSTTHVVDSLKRMVRSGKRQESP